MGFYKNALWYFGEVPKNNKHFSLEYFKCKFQNDSDKDVLENVSSSIKYLLNSVNIGII